MVVSEIRNHPADAEEVSQILIPTKVIQFLMPLFLEGCFS